MTAEAAMADRMMYQQPIAASFSRSLLLHVLLFGGLALYNWWTASGDPFGDKDAGGATVGVTMVTNIPLPSRGPENPVANDSKSIIPQEQPEKAAPKEAPKPDPEDAIALLPQERKSKQPLAPKSRLKSFTDLDKNQLTARTPQAVSNPMFAQSGAGQVGIGGDTTLGNRFPAYAAQIQDITRRAWRTQDVEASVKNGPPVTVRFTLLKDGRTENVRLIQRSGIPSLDLSVQNAVLDSHYPPLPDGFDRSSVPVEFTMVLKR